MKFLSIICTAVLLLAGCAGFPVENLQGEWEVVELKGKTLNVEGERPFLGFDLEKKTVYGYTGCNRLTGSLDAKQFLAGKPDFSRLGMTRMFCQDSPEQDFLDALNATKKVDAKGTVISLRNESGEEVMKLKKK